MLDPGWLGTLSLRPLEQFTESRFLEHQAFPGRLRELNIEHLTTSPGMMVNGLLGLAEALEEGLVRRVV